MTLKIANKDAFRPHFPCILFFLLGFSWSVPVELFRGVVGFRTSEGLGQVPAMAEYLASRFRSAGFDAGDVRVLPLGETASLVVRYRGSGGRPLLVLAH